mgnify:FL=1
MSDEPLRLWEPSVHRRDGVCMKTQKDGRWVLASDYNNVLRANAELTMLYDMVRKERDERRAEIDLLKKIIAKEVSENDEFGMEFVLVSILKQELATARAQIAKLRDQRNSSIEAQCIGIGKEYLAKAYIAKDESELAALEESEGK